MDFSRWFYLIAFIAGALTTLSFSPFEYYFIAWGTIALLFFILSIASTQKRHCLISYSFGLGLLASGASWVFVSMHFYASTPFLLALLFTVLFVSIIALVFLLLGLLTYSLKTHSLTINLILIFPAAWVTIEWLRSWLLTGFPWLLLAHGQIDTWMGNLAPIGGELLTSLATTMVSGSIVLLLLSLITSRRPQQLIALLSLISIIGISYIVGNISWTYPSDKALNVALLQGNIPQEEKWLPESLKPTIQRYLAMTEAVIKESDIIIWPETALPSYFANHMDDLINPLQSRIISESSQVKAEIIMGGFHYIKGDKPDTENALLTITQNGREVYGKQNLVPFSEYFPLLDYLGWLRSWVQLPFDSIRQGTGIPLVTIAGQRIRPSICYEDAYNVDMTRGLPEARLLINISNDGWFTGSIEPAQHMQIARMRAKETGRYLIRSTNIGISGIVDDKGSLITTTKPYTKKIIQGIVIPHAGTTPFVRFGNTLILFLLALIILVRLSFYTPFFNKKAFK